MTLATYNTKRHFDKTPEPSGVVDTGNGTSFVVQKHAARRLHYDFRLELDGVLKSWAVTRGPSLNPEDKRLAVEVEDHPLAYGDFEGIIPQGEYGAGTVILWDHGEWKPVGDARKGLKKGHLEFELNGEKLRGRWHLIRMKSRASEKRNNWLLVKGDDAAANRDDGDILLKEEPLSVKSQKGIEDMAAEPDASWKKGKKSDLRPASPKKQQDWPTGARAKPMTGFVKPQLATLKPKPPRGAKWLHEIKFDGYRIQAHIDDGAAHLLTRSGLDWSDKFGDGVRQALVALPMERAIIDGEIVVEGDNGVSDFSALQKDLSEERRDRFVYYAFDLLYLDDHDLRNVALVERKRLLKTLFRNAPKELRFSEHFSEAGGLVLDHACRLSLEGVVSKREDSTYRSGRSGQWIKSKCSERQEFVIGGFAPSSTSKSAIGSLALGVYDGKTLRHVGRVGTGFTRQVAEDLFERLEPMSRSESPFGETLSATERRGLVYVEPKLVAEVEFRAWSGDGNLRHASFRGLREDKPAEDIVQESRRTEKAPKPQSTVKLTHPDRLYWSKDGVTKLGLVDYYASVWKLMAPYVVDRPLALVRCPDGIDGQRFFQKHAWRGMNRHIDQWTDPKDKSGKPYLRILDFDGMIALVQSGVLEVHPWGATTRKLEQPDMITMDLDPGDDVAWSAVIEAALDLKQRIEDQGLAAFVKTSGGKGLHVVIPLTPEAKWPAAKSFARSLAESMARDNPDRYLAVSTKAKRKGRIYVDYLRNGRGATAVAPYSSRARAGAPVSMPLEWSELTEEIGPAHFTVPNIANRLHALDDDPWKDFFARARPLPGKS